jgi:hypothetical protein
MSDVHEHAERVRQALAEIEHPYMEVTILERQQRVWVRFIKGQDDQVDPWLYKAYVITTHSRVCIDCYLAWANNLDDDDDLPPTECEHWRPV